MVIASSISGLPIYAPSAAFAPTNSGDVSAIASAYQVVSSTATQLYAGTAYVTSINDAPISASRAGNAVNATQATSAWYDGTGRLISSLPDSAAVSAIASAYAESAASSKQDTLTFGYDDNDKISSINGSSLAGEGGGTTYVSPSGTVWISGSSIEGTDSAYFPDREETNLAYSASGFTAINTGSNAYTATGANIVYATGDWLNGTISALANNVLVAKSSYVGEVTMFSASADSGPLVLQSDNWWNMRSISAYTAGVTPASVVPLAHASSVSSKLDASASSQFQPSGHYQSAGNYLSASTVGFTDTSYTAVTSMSGVQLYGTDSAFNGVAVASGNGLWDTAIETAIVGTGHSQVAVHINGVTGQYFDVSAVDSAGSLLSRNTYDLDASGKTFVFPSASAISSLYINGNRYYKQYGYTASAFDIIPLAHASALPTYQYDAEDQISSINGSALAAGSTYSAGEGINITDDVISVETPVDIVAGPGIVIDNPDGNTLRVSMAQDYEVTLWSGTGTSGSTINLSETVKNFDRVRFYGHESNRGRGCLYEINPSISYDANTLQFAISTTDAAYAGAAWFVGQYLTYLTYTDTAATAMTVNGGEQWFSFSNTSAVQHNTARYVIIDKIVGINRTASAQ